MAQTQLSNIINPELFADALSVKLGDALKLQGVSFVQDLQGNPGGTISVPKYAYVGDASIVAEGVALDPTQLSQTADNVNVVKAGQAIEVTDEAASNGYGDPVGQAEQQLVRSVANKIEVDMMAALATATLTYDATVGGTVTDANAGDAVLNGLAAFGEDQEGQKLLFINAAEMVRVKKDIAFDKEANQLYGCDVVISNRVPAGSMYLVKPEAVGLYLKKDVNFEMDRDILASTTVLKADAHYATHLRDDSKAINITI